MAVSLASPRLSRRQLRLSAPCANVVVVINGNASGRPGPRAIHRLVTELRGLGGRVSVELTRDPDDVQALWQRDDGRRVVLVGGDGSVHTVVNLPGRARDVALIPAGRANNIARSLGIPIDWSGAAALAIRGGVRPIDLIRARAPAQRLLVVEGLSAGFLAQARRRYHARNSGQLLIGLSAGIGALASFRPLTARVHGADGDEWMALSQLFVANLPLYAFGLHVAPHARLTDGVLDVIGFEAGGRRQLLSMVRELRRGGDLRSAGAHLWRTRRIELFTDGCSPIIADRSAREGETEPQPCGITEPAGPDRVQFRRDRRGPRPCARHDLPPRVAGAHPGRAGADRHGDAGQHRGGSAGAARDRGLE
jgi:diacylglycerol kinase family enzyme